MTAIGKDAGEPQFTPGQYVVRRRYSRWSQAAFEVGRLVKLTAKRAVVHRYRDELVPLNELIAAFDTAEEAQALLQSLNGAVGTYREAARRAEKDCQARKQAAAETLDKVIENILAKARTESAQ